MAEEIPEVICEVIVAGWIDWAPAHRDRALAAFRTASGPSRAEPGCLDYVMTADPADAARVRVFERWTSAAALAEHLGTSHVREFRAQVADLVRTGRSLRRYEVSTGEDL